MQNIAADFNSNTINARINTATSQVEELREYHFKVTGTRPALPDFMLRSRPSATNLNALLELLRSVVGERDRLYCIIKQEVENRESILAAVDETLSSFVKPKLKSITEK